VQAPQDDGVSPYNGYCVRRLEQIIDTFIAQIDVSLLESSKMTVRWDDKSINYLF
jgi:hypothetical protein